MANKTILSIGHRDYRCLDSFVCGGHLASYLQVVLLSEGEISLEVLYGEVMPGYSIIQVLSSYDSSQSNEYITRLWQMTFEN